MPIQADARGFRVRVGKRLGQPGVALRHVPDGQGRLRRQAASSPSPVRSDERAGPERRRQLVSASPRSRTHHGDRLARADYRPSWTAPQGGRAGSLRRHRPGKRRPNGAFVCPRAEQVDERTCRADTGHRPGEQEVGRDMTVASPHCDGLRVVAPDGCTVADSAALQGFWTEAQYLALTNGSNRLLEFTDGHIEVLPVPTRQHQAISQFLFLALYFFVSGHRRQRLLRSVAPPHPRGQVPRA